MPDANDTPPDKAGNAGDAAKQISPAFGNAQQTEPNTEQGQNAGESAKGASEPGAKTKRNQQANEDSSLGQQSSPYTFNIGGDGPKAAQGDHPTFNDFSKIFNNFGKEFNGLHVHFHQDSGTNPASGQQSGGNQASGDSNDDPEKAKTAQKARKGFNKPLGGSERDALANDAFSPESLPTAIARWYYDLNEYDQCFVQAMAIFDGASVSAVGQATRRLYAPFLRRVQQRRASATSEDQPYEDGKGPLEEILERTYIRKVRVAGDDCFQWKDTNAYGFSHFKYRVLHCLAEESLMWSDNAFLTQLRAWATHLEDDHEYSAIHALGIFYWHNREALEETANAWVMEEGCEYNWYRASYLLRGAYVADSERFGEKALHKHKSPILQILETWVNRAYSNLCIGRAVALTYTLLGFDAPELAFRGLWKLAELDSKKQEEDISEGLYEAIAMSYFDLAEYGHLRAILRQFAERVEAISHHRQQLTGMTFEAREHRRLQRELDLRIACGVFLGLAEVSFSQLPKVSWVRYDLMQPLPDFPSFVNKDGREVLLAGILLSTEQDWRSQISVLLCAMMVERLNEFAFSILRKWADLVLKDQSATPDLVRQHFVNFIVSLGESVREWCKHLLDLGFHPPQTVTMFKRHLEKWQREGQRRNLPIGTLAQEILDQLPFSLTERV
jgi:hypothetical protein